MELQLLTSESMSVCVYCLLYVIITGWYLYTMHSRTTTSEGFTTVYHGPQYGLLYHFGLLYLMYVLIYFI